MACTLEAKKKKQEIVEGKNCADPVQLLFEKHTWERSFDRGRGVGRCKNPQQRRTEYIQRRGTEHATLLNSSEYRGSIYERNEE